jgi:hypothetical protein
MALSVSREKEFMSEHRDFQKTMAEMTDVQLMEALISPEDYLPEALEAARQEFHKRNHSPNLALQIEADVQQRKAAAKQPLGRSMRVLTFILGLLGIPGLMVLGIVAARYAKGGHALQESECLVWFGSGFVFWILVASLLYTLVRFRPGFGIL